MDGQTDGFQLQIFYLVVASGDGLPLPPQEVPNHSILLKQRQNKRPCLPSLQIFFPPQFVLSMHIFLFPPSPAIEYLRREINGQGQFCALLAYEGGASLSSLFNFENMVLSFSFYIWCQEKCPDSGSFPQQGAPMSEEVVQDFSCCPGKRTRAPG